MMYTKYMKDTRNPNQPVASERQSHTEAKTMNEKLLKLNSLITDYENMVMDLEAESEMVFHDRRIHIREAREILNQLNQANA